MNEQEQLRRAEAAQRILGDPLIKEARAAIETQLAESRRRVPIADTLMHTKLIMLEQLAGQFFAVFEEAVQTGKIAAFHLEEERRRESLRERAVGAFRRAGRGAL